MSHQKQIKQKKSQKNDPYENTMVVFPQSRDTTSNINEFDSYFYNKNSQQMNGIRPNKKEPDPTSPLNFTDAQKSESSNDFSHVLYNPHSSSSSGSESSNTVSVSVPSLTDHLTRYLDFYNNSRPPPISVADFYGLIQIRSPTIENLCISNIVTTDFINSFKSLIQEMRKTIHSSEDAISSLVTSLEDGHNGLLEKFQQFSETDQNDIVHNFRQITALYQAQTTLWVQEKIFNLEKKCYRDHFLQFYGNLTNYQEKGQTALISNPLVKKYNELSELQEKIQVARLNRPENSYKDKYINLKKSLSFAVTKIEKNNRGTVLLPYSSKAVIKSKTQEVHCDIAASFRIKEFDNELGEISQKLPFVMMRKDFKLYITFARYEDPDLRFDVIFDIPNFYPWCEIKCQTRVLIGSEKIINPKVAQICQQVSANFTRKPILEICKRLVKVFLQ